MPFSATVLPVIIASPGDVTEYRALARDVLHEWNYIHSSPTNVVLMPVGWETHASPELGSTPQELINERVLEDCDLLIGIFWTRLGTPTGRAASGTVEEIQRHVEAGKPAMIYFCEAPAALQTVDHAQYNALVEFRTWCATQGLIEPFLNQTEFVSKFRRQLQIAIQKNSYLRAIFSPATSLDGEATAQQSSTPEVDDFSATAKTLSVEAKSLLLAAADASDATIVTVDVLAGRLIQAGGNQFGEMEDPRSMARWGYGLQELLNMRLIERSSGGRTDRMFRVVHLGFQVADRIRQAPA
jgi:hypothetical protein